MAKPSRSIGNQQNLFALASAAAKKYAGQLPKEVAALAAGLEADSKVIATQNAKQESLKAELAKASEALKASVKAATLKRAKIVRMAEATFGPSGKEIREFRPATEGKV